MDFVGAIQAGFKNFAKFTGTAGRSEYWYWVLFTVLASLVASALDKITNISVFGSLVSLATFLPSLGLSVRRLRDAGKSWVWLLSPLPGLIIFFSGLVILAFELYNQGYVTTSAELNDPNFPSDALVSAMFADSHFYLGFVLLGVGLLLSLVFSLISNIIFPSLPTKTFEQGNKRVTPTF
jgi:uncharacterized membrane protein YhaH (DUF805 family)